MTSGNVDLRPTPPAQRTWSTYDMASLWVGLSVCIPTYMLAAGLVGAGMNWREAVLTILLGNVCVCVPLILVAHAGTAYGIPFPVLARASFGVRGSNVPALMRGLVGCGWFGIQTFIGGEAVATIAGTLVPAWRSPALSIGAFGLFWLLNMAIVVRGSRGIRALERAAAPGLILAGLALLAWAVWRADGVGPMLAQPSRFQTTGAFLAVFVPSLTAMVGFWATLALNIPDLSRYARNQRAQVVGQAIGLPLTMTLFSFIGIAVTSATSRIFGEFIWDPVQLVARLGHPAIVVAALVVLVVATLTTNVAANVVAPANSFANAWPGRITFVRGGVITGVLGVAIMPWRLMENPDRYLGWLVAYSGLLGPIAGILIADYWVVRRRVLVVDELYMEGGRYGRWHAPGLLALAAGVLGALLGLAIPSLRVLYDYAWFVGFGVAFIVYLVLAHPARGPGAA